MDEMRMIGTLLDEQPTEQSVTAGRERLQREMRAPRRRFSMPRLTIAVPVLATGAVAAVTAVAVALSSGTTPRAPDPAPAPADARTVLLAAASKIERSPAKHGKYWSVVRRERTTLGTSDGQFDVVDEHGYWDAGPGRTSWGAERSISSRYLGPLPANGPVFHPRKPEAKRDTRDTGMTRWAKYPMKGGQLYRLADWENVKAPDVRNLPDDPVRLKAFLAKELLRYQAVMGLRIDPDEWLFDNFQKIGAAPVSPKVLAAMYRVLATDPSLRVAGNVTDPLGRPGTAIARRRLAGPIEEQMVIDPATGRLLAKRGVQVKPDKDAPWAKVGDVPSYEAVLSYGWTDTVPAYPRAKIG